MRVLQRACWWVLDYAYAGYWRLRAAATRTSRPDFHSGTGRPVIVIPGIYETWQFLRPMVDALHQAGHPVHVVTMLQNNRIPVDRAAQLVADYLERVDLSDVAIVAHSKGGLIGKFLMMQPDARGRVHAMAAVCAPFSGSRYARFMLLPSLRAFSPSHAITALLATEVAVNARITSIFGLFDPHIPEGSELVGATNLLLPIAGHFRILSDRRCIDAVLEAVEG
ncbi:esterase/lipase family protein [Homoserinimonas sp. A447]